MIYVTATKFTKFALIVSGQRKIIGSLCYFKTEKKEKKEKVGGGWLEAF